MSDSNIIKSERGQTIIVFALLFSTLVLFTGLALDAGLLYATKAKLSSSVDGACLAGMKNLTLGQTTATTLATNIFNANYGANPPVPAITFPKDASNNQQVKVTATANVRTYFIRLISAFATVPVSDTAVATRGKLIMSLVLDRSGSMSSNGGGTALQAAVPQFVNNFDDTLDEVAMVSFSSNATVDFPIAGNFRTAIGNKVGAMNFVGGTFGTGAGTGSVLSTTTGPPLSLAQMQNDSVTITPGQNVTKVVVYFTDGLMNAVQDKFYCKGKNGNPANTTLVNYGGYDNGSGTPYTVGFLDPTSATNQWGSCNTGSTNDNCSSGLQYDNAHDVCKDINGATVSKFVSQTGGAQFLTRPNVTAEAQYRARQTATQLRTESPIPTYIYSIGLGSGVSLTTQAFLAELANDPNYATYQTTQPDGLFFYIPTCSPPSTCANQLNKIFQTIAARILLRLTA